MKLISGFIETQSWKIIIDWQNLNEINLMNYYKEIWYLTQEPNVFDWSILENLTYWSKQEITEKKLKEVIKKAKCEFIYDFKNWLKTEIWERWVRLSWWQKQRLAIAKIFLKNPKIIFLDEPTSALDSKSEKLIHESFTELFKWRTVIIIAHRLQTVKSADEIFVIEEGKIVEIWNHESLSRKKGHYREMLDLQSGF
jgi:ABC-type multidrug transport system fused ATPase/permease subunit